MIKAVIMDDEYYALEGLKMELQDIGGIEVAAAFQDEQKLLDEIVPLSPDVIFLDIEMPKYNGFELLHKLQEKGVTANVVFVTAYDHYAVKAFEINAVDYILKPVSRNRLVNTLQRISPETAAPKSQKIQISCFKHFSITANSQEINTGWRTRKAEELIAYLLCEKGKFISKEKIAEALWPEQDSEKSLSNLYLAYYYIKKQENKTGVRIPLESERGKMRINLELVECDLTDFNRLVEGSRKAAASEAASMMEKAVELYQGALFEDGFYSWAEGIQQHYEIIYEELLNRLTDYFKRETNRLKVRYYEEKIRNCR